MAQVYRSIHIPSYIPFTIIFAAGVVMQYLWAAWRPEYRNEEIIAHGGLYYTGGLNEDFDVKQPQARDDNYLVLLGFFLFIESSDLLHWVFSNPLFVYLGRRSLSKHSFPHPVPSIPYFPNNDNGCNKCTLTGIDAGYFIVQSIMIYTLGIKLYQTLHIANDIASVAVCFFVTLAASASGAEIFYRAVEVPSHVLSHMAFDWIRE